MGIRSNENHRYDPSSPYSASKASADHLVKSYIRTYGLKAIPAPSNDVALRIEAVDAALQRLLDGKAGFLMDTKCINLKKGFNGGYHYRRLQTSGDRYDEKPLKNRYSHVHDALQYLMMGAGEGRTILSGKNGQQPVDTGFIVFNYPNYPELSQLFAELNVPVAKSDMSFGASLKNGKIEYALRNFDAIFAQRKNVLNPQFMKMVWDINRFNTIGLTVADDESLTIGQFLKRLKTGDWFRDYYLLPLSGAIWSNNKKKILYRIKTLDSCHA